MSPCTTTTPSPMALDPLGPSTRQGKGKQKRFLSLGLCTLSCALHLPSRSGVLGRLTLQSSVGMFPRTPHCQSSTLDSQTCLIPQQINISHSFSGLVPLTPEETFVQRAGREDHNSSSTSSTSLGNTQVSRLLSAVETEVALCCPPASHTSPACSGDPG